MSTASLTQKMTAMCSTFLDKIRVAQDGIEISDELETRFKKISKINQDNVVKKLISLGFTRKPVVSSLNVLLNNGFRVSVTGEQNVYQYCNNGRLTDKMLESMEKKTRDDIVDFAEANEYPFRIVMSTEQPVSDSERESIKTSFNSIDKSYRYIRRVSFTHENYPYLVIDMSTVKQSSPNQNSSFLNSGIFRNIDMYEIEIEFSKNRSQYFLGTQDMNIALKLTDTNVKKMVITQFQKYIKYILGGLQESNYPISFKTQDSVLSDYKTILGLPSGTKDNARRSIFIGPSSKTLQIDNVVVNNENELKVPNVRVPGAFCVTEKADGDRHLMLVNSVGKIYLITSNMQVKFTGASCDPKICKNTIIDGELITQNKKKEFINTYAAFDLYYMNGVDVRFLKFMPIPKVLEKSLDKTQDKDVIQPDNDKIKTGGQEDLNAVHLDQDGGAKKKEKDVKDAKEREEKEVNKDEWAKKYRFVLLTEVINAIRLQTTAVNASMIFKTKSFYPTIKDGTLTKEDDINTVYNIFRASKLVLGAEYPYNTDGAIFTHTTFGVGGYSIGATGPLHKITWDLSLKWKPASMNTNDFLAITEKDKAKGGADKTTDKFLDGTNMLTLVQNQEYKHLQLFCGNRSQNEIFAHPCEDVYNGIFPTRSYADSNTYQATPFIPTNPYDANAQYCSILLNKDGLMITEEGQPFESDTIIECRYDIKFHKWIPMRVRYDKTAEYKEGKKPQFGNSFETANSNWTSIHNPVTEYMITNGKMENGAEIEEQEQPSDAYYKTETSSQQTQTQGLRDFHNKYVKQWLIKSVCQPGNTLIDLACGKAGDLQKWIHAQLSFVYGIDYSGDNLTNLLNGACSRYLNTSKKFHKIPKALFVQGDSGKNIRSGLAIMDKKGKEINDVVFGEHVNMTAQQIATNLGKGVMNQANKGKDGFNITSCQFAMHYMFATPSTFYNFVENIAECTKNNGYYIATCYDGNEIFRMLKDRAKDSIIQDSKLVWEVVKKYSSDRRIFPNDETSLGMEISVYQESIGQWASEYLVNFEFFNNTMNEYGMYLLTDAELNTISFPLKKSSGLFGDLFQQMNKTASETAVKSNQYGDASKMTDIEKKISFLNRYFIYRSRNHTKKDFAKLTAEKLSKHSADKDTDKVNGDVAEYLGNAVGEEKMADIMETVDSLEDCHYDSRLHNVLAKITKEKNKKSPNIQNILDLITNAGENASSARPTVRLLENIDEQLKQYKKKMDPEEGKEFICDRIMDYFSKHVTKKKTKFMTDKTKVIDIGGGNGNLLHCFSDKFSIPKDRLVSIENGSFEYTYTHGKTVTYETLKEADKNNINALTSNVFKDADYIFCMVTLHHMTDENIRNTVVFIKNHLKRNGGYLVIKEHDADSQDTECLINWEHHLYRMMEHSDGNMPKEELQKYVDDIYIGNYKQEAYFDALFKSAGLSLVSTLDNAMYAIKTGDKKWERNPTQLYWKIYKY